ncbi:MAG: XRE family transcriptional regulator, partial [Cytophagaceae bacterium]
MTRISTATKQVVPRIAKILTVEPFQLTVLWTTAEIRRINFALLFDNWRNDNDSRLYPLFDFDTFKQVTLSPTHTLCWPTINVQVKLATRIIQGPLELDPDELYRQSVLIQKTEPIAVGVLLRKAREAAGLSQTEVATKSGTSRNYISRIENGKSDIQLETLKLPPMLIQ